MKFIVKYFFLADICLGVVIFDLNKYIFPWQVCFICGGHLRLELSCIQVNVVIFINTKYLGCLNKYDLFSRQFIDARATVLQTLNINFCANRLLV